MPDEPIHLGRFDQRDESRSCTRRNHRPHDGCSVCLPRLLRPYRVVKRYRGDRQPVAFRPAEWCDVWRLQAGDVGWPDTRED
jgi:hypothetical protein